MAEQQPHPGPQQTGAPPGGAQQGDSNSDSMQSTGATDPTQDVVQQRLPYWLRQTERFLRVIVRIYIGLGVCVVPWIPPVWDANPFFAQSPWLLSVVTNGAVRGLISGLGLLNLWIALRDALQPLADSAPKLGPGPR